MGFDRRKLGFGISREIDEVLQSRVRCSLAPLRPTNGCAGILTLQEAGGAWRHAARRAAIVRHDAVILVQFVARRKSQSAVSDQVAQKR